MNAYNIIEKRFIEPFRGRTIGNVGVELEFPLINMNKKPIDEEIANGLLSYFLDNGFTVDETTVGGKSAFISNSSGDYLSFDNSYNNFEFAMNYGNDLCSIAKRFYGYFDMAQAFLKRHNYLLSGMGTHPYKQYINQAHVDYPVYNMVDSYLHKYPAKHAFPDFPAYLSSVQTHLDTSLSDLPRVATLFARLDFIRALLFSNSPSWSGDNVLCYRDFLWEGSAFPNTGKVDEKYENLNDIIQSFLKRKMFNKVRNSVHIAFEPVVLKEYFGDEKYCANENDIKQFLSFRNIEITSRGTLEVRSDSAQPICDAFAPPAFSLGRLYNMDKAITLLDNVLINYKTSEIRDNIINGIDLDIPKGLCTNFVELAEQGLKTRGKGEEKLLAPLFERAHHNSCPAKKTLSRLKNGEPIENIILDYSVGSFN